MKKLWILNVFLWVAGLAFAQQPAQKPDAPIEKWTGKTIMLIGAHADDDALSHGTLALLQAHGNRVYIVTLTTGNVGTQDPNLSRMQLAQIRRQEELAALAELGIPETTTSIWDTMTGSWNSKIARRWWKIWCAGSASSARMCLWLGTRGKIISAGINRIIALHLIWLPTRRAPPCGGCCSRARSLRKVCVST